MTDIIQLSPTELKQWQDEGRAFHLLDVRTDEERAICTLPAAIHIPMNLIPLRQNELPDDDLPMSSIATTASAACTRQCIWKTPDLKTSTTCKAVLMLGQCRWTAK